MPTRNRYCEMKAAELLRDAGITTPPVDMKGIAESLFLPIVQSDTREHGGRALLDHGEIHVNAAESPAAQRFSIGHEIGHQVLHPDSFVFSAHEDPESELYSEDPTKELEREADYFSSVLLVPPKWLREDVKAGMSPDQLAIRYQVSRDVIFIALTHHRLLNRGGRRRR